MDIFAILIPDIQSKIIYLSQGKNSGETVPMMEVRLEKTEDALVIRKAYICREEKEQAAQSQIGYTVHLK